MCSDIRLLLLSVMLTTVSCTTFRNMERIREGEISLSMSVADEVEEESADEVQVSVDSIRESLSAEPLIMNAIKDTETGEMIAVDVIQASRVVARFRNVAERNGYVSVCFDIIVPPGMTDSRWQLKVAPRMTIFQDTVFLDPVYVTGAAYREKQLRGYERYRNFVSSIITDTTDLIRTGQLEIFLERHFPGIYAMKTDSSYVSDRTAENVFGVTIMETVNHYRRHFRWFLNERRKSRVDDMYDRFIKDPVRTAGVRLDTVLLSSDNEFIYRYTHTFRSRPRLRKVNVALRASLYEEGECLMDVPFPEELTFYISSLATLTDDVMRYKMYIRQRYVRDNTKALIDFAHSSAVIDTTLADNASELRRVARCFNDVLSEEEYALDSLVITASCSPEGSLDFNRRLSVARSEAVCSYVERVVPEEWKSRLRTSSIPENWDQLMRLVENDTIISMEVKRKIFSAYMELKDDPDMLEKKISGMDCYRYMREKIYPKLRAVGFDFHMHRVDMVQDTVHTLEPDTVYLSGVQAMKEMDYKKAVTMLRPYGDYNAALAFVCAGYDHSAADLIDRLDECDGRVCYLKSLVLARFGMYAAALKYLTLAIASEPSLEHRANLDPEMYEVVKMKNKK